MIMLLLGIGSLLPWNAILTALDFFKEKVRDSEYLFCIFTSDSKLINNSQLFFFQLLIPNLIFLVGWLLT